MLVQSELTFCSLLDGLIYYKQASRLSVLHACLIALGTAILLSGVLALSWRLSEEPPPGGPQTTTQSAITPSLGLLEHHPDASDPESRGVHRDDNEDSEDENTATETTSLLRRSRSGDLIGSTSMGGMGTTAAGRQSRPGPRRRAMTEVEEIWGELEDHGNAGRRSRCSKWPPSKQQLFNQRRKSKDIDEELAAGRLGTEVGETTSLIGSSTKRPGGLVAERTSYMFPPVSSAPTTPWASGPSTPLEGSRRPSTSEARFSFSTRGSGARGAKVQEAIGGWWPMKWWNKSGTSTAEVE